jgi:hypothetical protein
LLRVHRQHYLPGIVGLHPVVPSVQNDSTGWTAIGLLLYAANAFRNSRPRQRG